MSKKIWYIIVKFDLKVYFGIRVFYRIIKLWYDKLKKKKKRKSLIILTFSVFLINIKINSKKLSILF